MIRGSHDIPELEPLLGRGESSSVPLSPLARRRLSSNTGQGPDGNPIIEDKPFLLRRSESITLVSMAFCLTNSMLGTELLHMGSTFSTGLISCIITTLIVCVASSYSMWLFVQTAAAVHRSHIVDIVRDSPVGESTLGRHWSLVALFFCAVPSVLKLRGLIRDIVAHMLGIIRRYTEIPDWAADHFLLSAIVVVATCGFSLGGIRVVVWTSFVSLAAAVALFVIVIIRIFNGVSIASVLWMESSPTLFKSIGSICATLALQPVVFPGLTHLNTTIPSRLNKLFIWSIVAAGSVVVFFGIAQGTSPVEDVPALEMPWRCASLIMLLCSIPPCLSASQFLTAYPFIRREGAFEPRHGAFGVILLIVAAVLGHEAGIVGKVLDIVRNVLATLIHYSLPALLYWLIFKTRVHRICSLVVAALGLAVAGLVITGDVS